MPRFTINFRGLICHVAENEGQPDLKTHATIVDAPAHKPMIILPNKPPIDLKDGDVVRFAVGEGTARADNLVNIHVPRLKMLRLLKDDLTDDVRHHNHTNNDKVSTFVLYPDGSLTVTDVFRIRKLQFLDDDDNELARICMSKVVRFTSDSSDPTELVITDKNGNERREPIDGDTIEIRNETGSSGKHFHMYEGLARNPGIARIRETAEPCTLGQEISESDWRRQRQEVVVPDDPDPECSNSQWP